MMETECVYDGLVDIYLEGQRVLSPIKWLSNKMIEYFLGTPESKIKIIDYRNDVNQMAISAIENFGRGWSAQLFSKSANARVNTSEGTVTIELWDTPKDKEKSPILWIGVTPDDELPANPLSWLWLAESGDSRTAFVGLIQAY